MIRQGQNRLRSVVNRYILFSGLGVCLVAQFGAFADEQAKGNLVGSPPNIIVILADDLGWGDLSVQGSTRISTPNIDSIAARGVRFTDAYVPAPICSPSRAGFLSGRYQQRFGYEFSPSVSSRDPNYKLIGLPKGEVLLPQLMKDAGYATGMVGKWHLGVGPDFVPLARGFEEFFGFLGSQSPYTASADTGQPLRMIRGNERVEVGNYLTDAFASEAVEFIRRRREKPFFLYLAFNAPHTPLQATQQYLDRVAHIGDADKRTYAAMVVALDDAVGRILGALDETNLTGRSMVIFLSDNGGVFRPGEPNFADNGPLRAGKMFVHEGGTRIPFMMQWPGQIEPGAVCRHPVSSVDVFSTVLAAAYGTIPSDRRIDSVNLMPFITGRVSGAPHEFLVWRLGRNHALRKGDWKILQYADRPVKLFNLADDIGESNDLASAHPEIVNELVHLYSQWESETVAPIFKIREPVPIQFEGEQLLFDI